MAKPLSSRDGFTLIEIIAVLMVLGLLLAFTSMSGMDTRPLRSDVDKIANDIRYAQAMAMTHGATWGITFAGGSYFVWEGTEAAKKLIPGNTTPDIPLTPVTGPTYSLSFDTWGIPYNATTGTALANDITLGFSKSGQTISVTISSDTGQVL